MYELINRHRNAVLDRLEQRDDVGRYTALCRDMRALGFNVSTDSGFQRRYKAYWGVNRRDERFCKRYFELLGACQRSKRTDIAATVRELGKVSFAGTKPRLEFSFTTKLAHMVDPRVPVYDSLVAAFFFYGTPPNEQPFEDRLRSFVDFHAFLEQEYSRVVRDGLLDTALRAFRTRFVGVTQVRRERVVDWMIWSWIALLRGGAQRSGELLYR